jgi:hypothetical protein
VAFRNNLAALLLLLLLLLLQAWLLLHQLALDGANSSTVRPMASGVSRLGALLSQPLLAAWLDSNMAQLTPSKVRRGCGAKRGAVGLLFPEFDAEMVQSGVLQGGWHDSDAGTAEYAVEGCAC